MGEDKVQRAGRCDAPGACEDRGRFGAAELRGSVEEGSRFGELRL
jgi:hypothetical protein